MSNIPEVLLRDKFGRFAPGPRIVPNLRPSSSLAYILGSIKGDGSIIIAPQFREYKIGLRVTDVAFAELFFKCLGDIGLNPWMRQVKRQRDKWRDQIRVLACSKAFVLWYQKLSTTDIFNLVSHNTDHMRAFIAGFFDAEGCIFQKTRYRKDRGYSWVENQHVITLTNTDRELIETTDSILRQLGFSFHLNNKKPIGKRIPCYELRTSKKETFDKFIKEIPSTKCLIFGG